MPEGTYETSENAFEIPSDQFTLNAAGSIKRHRFVKVNASGQAEYATSASDGVVGVSYMSAEDTQPLAIAGGGIVMVEVADGTSINAGDLVSPTSEGKASSGAAGSNTFVALTSGGAMAGNVPQLISIKL